MPFFDATDANARIGRSAFDDESWARLTGGFPLLIDVNEQEAVEGFALNGHCPDGHNILLPAFGQGAGPFRPDVGGIR